MHLSARTTRQPIQLVLICVGCLLATGCSSDSGEGISAELGSLTEPIGGVPAGSVGAGIELRDVSAQTGIEFFYENGADDQANSILESLGGGVTFVDFDADGRQDLFLPGGGGFGDKVVVGRRSALMRNLGDEQFVDVAALAGVDGDQLYTHGCHVGDMDNDGFPDLLVTGYGDIRLYHNQGDGTFLEVHQQAGLANRSWSTAAAWGDINGDGFADLYICNYVNWSFKNDPSCVGPQDQPDVCPPKLFDALPDVLFFNNGDGTFRDVSDQVGLVTGTEQEYSKGLGVLMADIDLDGDLDIYVANDTTPNYLYLNDGSGLLEEVGLIRSVALDAQGGANGSMGIDLGDYNGDQLPDLWVSNFEQEAFGLYENHGRGMFLHSSEKTGITSLGGLFVGFGTAFLDVDLDGDEDLLVTNGHVIKYPLSGRVEQLPLLLVNDQGRRFQRRQFPAGEYFSTPHAGRGLAIGDLVGDGKAEIVISHIQQPCAVIANQSSAAGAWLSVRLIGRNGARDAVGATVVLHTSSGDQLRMVKGGGSYMSQNEYRLFWGYPEDSQMTGLTVRWPGGLVEEHDAVIINDSIVLIEAAVVE